MQTKITKWFQAPVFPEDVDKTRAAFIFNAFLNLLFVALPILFLNIASSSNIANPVPQLITLFCLWLSIFWQKKILHDGHVNVSSIVLISVMFVGITFIIYNLGTIRTPATSFYLLTIMISGLSINRRALLGTAVITAALITLLATAEANGQLPAPNLSISPTQVVTFFMLVILITLLESVRLKNIDEILAQARSELAERILAKEREIRRSEMMEKVILVGKSVTEKTSDLRTALRRIWDGIHNELDFDRTAIFLYDTATNNMQGTYGTDRSGKLVEEWDLKYGLDENAFFKKVLSQPDGYYFTNDYETERGLLTRPGHRMRGVKYYAAVSVWAGDKPVAIIVVDQLISNRTITEEQLEALRFFAGYAGLAIENARLSEREQKRREMMEKVIQIGKIVTEQTVDFHTTLLRIRDSVCNDLNLDRAAVFTYDSHNDTLQGSYGTDRNGYITEEWHMNFNPGAGSNFLQRVISQPDGFYHTDDYERDLEPSNMASDDIMKGVKHYVAVACWSGDKPIAIICADQFISGRPITEEQQEALRLFAGYAGLAIDNARLNTELKGRMQEREQFIRELGNRNAELERFTYTVSHDLRSPIITIKGFIGMLDKDIQEGKKERTYQDIQRISNAADKMDTLLKNLLELSRIGRLVNPPEKIDLVRLTYDTLETIDGRLRTKNITARVSPDLPTIYGDRIRISEVMENLIDNAAKYMSDRPDPLIEIGTKTMDGEQVIYVKDNGIGIEPQYLQKVFGLFEKLNPTSEGTGIGLALVKRIVEIHGGRIWGESEGLGKGSTFYFTLPSSEKEKTET